MANKIYIKYVSLTKQQENKESSSTNNSNQPNSTGGKKSAKYEIGKTIGIFPLLEEIMVDIQSRFTTFSGMVPMLETFVNTLVTVSTLGGEIGEGTIDLQNMFNVPRWERTEPVRINTRLHFFADENPEVDVYKNMMDIINLTIPSRDGFKGRFKLPGISLSTLQQSKRASTNDKKETFSDGKFISLKIPGIIYLPIAMVTVAKPTYSKEVTESGFPLWGTLEFEAIGLTPVTSDDLNNTLNVTKDDSARKKKKLSESTGNVGTATGA